jgi:tryptophan synthase alpha chain
MGRLRACLSGSREDGRARLVVFVMAGDPDLDTTHELVLRLEEWGVDAVELGIPFSDPIADGPVIQKAAERALAAGVTVQRVLDLVERIRQRSDIPIVLFTYVNPVMRFGLDRFAQLAKARGADGALLLDLPPEEADGYLQACRNVGLETVFLLAPTSTEDRIRRAVEASSGFLYCVSRTGVTGEREKLSSEVENLVARVRRVTDLPIAVGFGISRGEHARQVARYADAVVVGSAVVRRMAEGSREEGLLRVRGLIEELSSGLSGRGWR